MAKVLNQINVGSDSLNIASTAYATCSTAAGTVAKVAYIQGETASTGFTLSTGVTIHVKFTNANSASNPTLNVNGTGAKSIKRYGTTAPGNANTSSWYAGEVVTLTYDGTYWQMNKTVDNNTDNDKKTSSGDTSSKIYLVGATSQSTSGQTTYSHNEVYVDTDGTVFGESGFRAPNNSYFTADKDDGSCQTHYGFDHIKQTFDEAEYSEYTLEFPHENGTLATQEWVENKVTDLENTISGNIKYLDNAGNFITNAFDNKKVRFTALVDVFDSDGPDGGVSGSYVTFSDGSKLGLIIYEFSQSFWGYEAADGTVTKLYDGNGGTYASYSKQADYIEVDLAGLTAVSGSGIGYTIDMDTYENGPLTEVIKVTTSSSSSGSIDGITSTEDKIILDRDIIEVGDQDSSETYTIELPKTSGTLATEYAESTLKSFSNLKVGEDLSGVTLQFNTSAYPQPYGSTYYDYNPNIYLEFANGYRFGLNAEGSGGYQYGLFDMNNQLLYTFFNDNGVGGQDGWKMTIFTMPANSVITNINETTDQIMDNIYGTAVTRVNCESLYKSLQNKADVYTGFVSLAGTLNNFYQMSGPCYGPDVCGRIDGGNTGFVLYCPDSSGSVDLYYSSDLANRTADVHLYNHGSSSSYPAVLSGSGSVAQIKASSIEWDMSAFTNNCIPDITQADLDAAIQCVHATPKTNFEAIQTLKTNLVTTDTDQTITGTKTITGTSLYVNNSAKTNESRIAAAAVSVATKSVTNGTATPTSRTAYRDGNIKYYTTDDNTAAGTLNLPINSLTGGATYTIATEEYVQNAISGVGGGSSSTGGNVYYGTCSTAAATTAKTVSLSNYVLSTGGIVSVYFTYAVPASATLNINSRGAKSIYYRNAAIKAGVIGAGDTATFIYDGTYYRLISIDYAQAESQTV